VGKSSRVRILPENIPCPAGPAIDAKLFMQILNHDESIPGGFVWRNPLQLNPHAHNHKSSSVSFYLVSSFWMKICKSQGMDGFLDRFCSSNIRLPEQL
jgi:hypothetical protein